MQQPNLKSQEIVNNYKITAIVEIDYMKKIWP